MQETNNLKHATTDHIVITVHGTGDSSLGEGSKKWWEADSTFASALKNGVDTVPIAIRPFRWSGANSQIARERAATELAEILRSQSGYVRLIAHSHGGHVCLRALSTLKEWHFDRVTLLLIGTPFIVQRFSSTMWLNLLVAFFAMLFVPLIGWAIIALTFLPHQILALLLVFSLVLVALVASFLSVKMNTTNWYLLTIGLVFLTVHYLYTYSRLNTDWTIFLYSSCLFLLSSLCFVHVGKILVRIGYDRKIQQTLDRRNLDISDLCHPKDEVCELFAQTRKFELNLLSKPFLSSILRSVLIYLHFGVYFIISVLLLTNILNNNSAGFAELHPSVIVHMSSVYSGVLSSFILTYVLVELVARVLRTDPGGWMTKLANGTLHSALRGSMLGSDAFSATEYDGSAGFQAHSHIKIPHQVEIEMAENAKSEAHDMVERLLQYNILRPDGVIGSFKDLEHAFSWKSLLHCRYFETPFVVDTIVGRIRSSFEHQQTSSTRRDPTPQ